jgi:hypothetical protein
MLKYKDVKVDKKFVAFTTAILLLAAIISIAIIATPIQQSAVGQDLVKKSKLSKIAAPIAISGNNVYIAWSNNETGHWNVFFAKSIDGGKTFGKTIILSSPNTGNTIAQNTEIAASGNNVYVTWWTNKTGSFEPVFRASNDNGNTFGNIIQLINTANGVSK